MQENSKECVAVGVQIYFSLFMLFIYLGSIFIGWHQFDLMSQHRANFGLRTGFCLELGCFAVELNRV